MDKKDFKKIKKSGFPWTDGYLIANSEFWMSFWISFLMNEVDSLLDCASKGYKEIKFSLVSPNAEKQDMQVFLK